MSHEVPEAFRRPARWVDRPEDLEEVARRVAVADLVALDTEGNSLHAYRERTCVVQVTVGDDTDLLDPLTLGDLSPLGRALDRDDVEVVFHGGDYDVSVLSRDHGLAFRRVFDTMIAATMLGAPKVGLADLVLAEFGVALDKKFQTADWARRPLAPEHLEYLRRDTVFLAALRHRLAERLAAADLVEEGEIEFRRLAARRGRAPAFDPEGWRRLDGASRLPAEGRAVLRALHLWRERVAEERDVPPFKVLPPRSLVDLAARPPRRPEELAALHPKDRQRHGRAVLQAVAEGLAAAARGEAPAETVRPRLDAEARAARDLAEDLEDDLRKWRKAEAARRSVPNLVVLPNPGLDVIVATHPSTVEELAAIPDVGAKRAARYGREILDVLARRLGRGD